MSHDLGLGLFIGFWIGALVVGVMAWWRRRCEEKAERRRRRTISREEVDRRFAKLKF